MARPLEIASQRPTRNMIATPTTTLTNPPPGTTSVREQQQRLNTWLAAEHAAGRYINTETLVVDGIHGPLTRALTILHHTVEADREYRERTATIRPPEPDNGIAYAEAGDMIPDPGDRNANPNHPTRNPPDRESDHDRDRRPVPNRPKTRDRTHNPAPLPAGFQQIDPELALESEYQIAILELQKRNPDHPAGTSFAEFDRVFWHPGHPVYEAARDYALATILPTDTKEWTLYRRQELRRTGAAVKETYDREFAQPADIQRDESARPEKDLPLGPNQKYGKRPSDVRWVQTVLADLGYPVKPTGKWNRGTTKSLQMFAGRFPYTPKTPGEISEQADWEALIAARKSLDMGHPPSRAVQRAAQAGAYDLWHRDDPRITYDTLNRVNNP